MVEKVAAAEYPPRPSRDWLYQDNYEIPLLSYEAAGMFLAVLDNTSLLLPNYTPVTVLITIISL